MYCCGEMQRADKAGFIDYSTSHLTTIDTAGKCYPINFCPFCGAKLSGTKKSIERVEKYFGKRGR